MEYRDYPEEGKCERCGVGVAYKLMLDELTGIQFWACKKCHWLFIHRKGFRSISFWERGRND